MASYQHIFFDLDHTLWDFNTNCRLTLNELYDHHNLHSLGFTKEAFYLVYKEINDKMWYNYHRGLVTKEDIRSKRFEVTFEQLGRPKSEVPSSLEQDFLANCPTKGVLFPHTLEVLDYLSQKGMQLHIITNGFKETQQIKLATSGLADYFKIVVEPDNCGFMKPDPRIFHHALQLSGSTIQDSIMIGDDLHVDVLGAKKVGLAQVFVNRNEEIHQEEITHEIDCLSKLKSIL